MRRAVGLSRTAQREARRLGASIRAARKDRGWTLDELAERVGVTHVTLRKVERGDPTVSFGAVLEAAALVGVEIFGIDDDLRRLAEERVMARAAALPASTRRRRADRDDEF